MYISVRFFLLNTKNLRSIALIRENGILLEKQRLPCGRRLYFYEMFFFLIRYDAKAPFLRVYG